MTPAVTVASTSPATVRCASSIAGIDWDRWNGAYSGVPSARWNSSGCTPNSIAAASAAALMPAYAPIPAASTRRGEVSDVPRDSSVNRPYATNGMTTAMLNAFAGYASSPPSPKNSAWMSSAADTATQAAHGPSSTAISPAPTACAVVPSGIGTLNIMTAKENAAPSAT